MTRLRLTSTLLSLLLLFAFNQLSIAQETDTMRTPDEICEAALPAPEPETRDFEKPDNVLEVGVDYYAIFCTEVGPVYVDLFETFTPTTVNNFVFLSQNGFYNNTTFHRVIENFMAQGGDPTGTGMGGPGYNFVDEFVPFLTFDRVGLLAMANSGENTNGSQFFLTTFVTDWLDYRHTIFGEVVYGQEIVEGIPLRDPMSDVEPGAIINTVVIITDAATVDVELPTNDESPVTEADFQATLQDFPELPQSLVVDEANGILDSVAVAAQARNMETDLAAVLGANNHQFTVIARILNGSCDLEQAGFARAGVAVHVFESDADAQAIVTGDSLALLSTLQQGEFERVSADDLFAPVFVGDADACGTPGKLGYMARQNGRFVIISEVLVPEESASVDQWFRQVINPRIFDFVFANEYERELRDR